MALRIFLGASALLWGVYGAFCFFQPGYLAEAAGVTAASTTATIELRAMYGGLQVGIGALAGLALWRASLRRPALLMLLFLCAGLGLSRLLGAALDGEVSSYTGSALGIELGSTACAAWLLSRIGPGAPA